jgi:hypothetical protein
VGFPSSPPHLPAHGQLVSSSFNAAPKCASPHCVVAAASNAAESRGDGDGGPRQVWASAVVDCQWTPEATAAKGASADSRKFEQYV